MMGPTGVGKTEIARRLAKLAQAPFIKVEATKFTEVGYVGRDVESIIRDLVESAIMITRTRLQHEVATRAEAAAEKRVIDVLAGPSASRDTRQKMREKLRSGQLDEQEIEIEVSESPGGFPSFELPGVPGTHVGMVNLGELLGKSFGNVTQKRRMTVGESHNVLIEEESNRLIDDDELHRTAIDAVEQNGIVFLDEIDKITRAEDRAGADVSREGVQRDLLPLIEGTVVPTKHGQVRTGHILFIASGAFHLAKPSDLLPELQGRLPIRVSLDPLSEADLVRILTEPENSLTRQYEALLATDGVKLEFRDDGISALARLAAEANHTVENIGARRLHTICERLLEDISFSATDRSDEVVTIDEQFVLKTLSDEIDQSDLNRFIL